VFAMLHILVTKGGKKGRDCTPNKPVGESGEPLKIPYVVVKLTENHNYLINRAPNASRTAQIKRLAGSRPIARPGCLPTVHNRWRPASDHRPWRPVRPGAPADRRSRFRPGADAAAAR